MSKRSSAKAPGHAFSGFEFNGANFVPNLVANLVDWLRITWRALITALISQNTNATDIPISPRKMSENHTRAKSK